MRSLSKPALPGEAAGASALRIDNAKCPDDRSDVIVFAEPWAAQHNTELWGKHRPELKTDPGK